ncbi:hypothetical protein LSTR_LSTR014050, partial [Laodelphax striatellus]
MSSVICKDDQGAFIPATQRPDGSWRKPRRIKDGYVPQEEVPLYESRGRRQMQDSAALLYPPGLHPDLIRKKEAEKARLSAGPVIKYSPAPGVVLTQGGVPEEAKSKKKKKKKSSETNSNTGSQSQPKQPTKSADSSQKTASKSAELSQKSTNSSQKSAESAQKSSTDSSSAPTDPAKRLKNLRKKLRVIEELEQKMANGQKDKLDKDQLEKVARKPDV